jgi:uncharacterized protein with von Willebrand factor type A (vWA) domain
LLGPLLFFLQWRCHDGIKIGRAGKARRKWKAKMGNEAKKFDPTAGAMDVSDWVALQAEDYLTISSPKQYRKRGDTPESRSEKLDMFSALYGLDSRKAIPGEHGGRSAQLMDEAQALPQWASLQAKSEAKPWACATAAEQILQVVGQLSHDQQRKDEKEKQARQQLQQAERNLDQAKKQAEQEKREQEEKSKQEQKGEQGGENGDSDAQDKDGDGEQGSEGENGQTDQDSGDQSGEGDGQDGDQGKGSEGDSQDGGDQEGDGGEGQGDGEGQIAEGEGSQDSQQPGGNQAGSGSGQEQQAQMSAAEAQVVEAEKDLKKAAKAYQKAQRAAEQAREDGKAMREHRMAQAMEQAEQQIDDTEEALRGMKAGMKAGTEQAFGTPVDKIARQISKNKEFSQIMKWAGRMAITGRAKARQRRGGGSSEVVDVTTGGISDICDAVPSEMLGLVDPDLEILMDKRICEESLQIEKKRDRDPEERGPVVACVDESGSMDGDRLMWAKAVAFAMFLRCVEENRPFAVVRFESWQQVISFRKPREANWDDLSKWLNGFLCGGTNIPAALIRADEFIDQQPGFKKADVLLVTDGYGGHWWDVADQMRKKGRSIYGVRIACPWDDEDKLHLEESIHVQDKHLGNVNKTLDKLEGALAV